MVIEHIAMDGSGIDGVDAKALLYSVIERLGRDELRRDLAKDSRSAIATIMHSCMKELSSNDMDKDKDVIIRLVTALMHYLLTECMIQSERKIQLDDVMLDLVIPSMRALRSNPDNTLIILIARGDEMGLLNNRLERVYALHPKVNVWAVIVGDAETDMVDNVRVYMMDEYVDQVSKSKPSRSIIPLSSIIEDIRRFMNSRGIRPFNIVA
ncbi:hypothetical protein [Candidatus Nitrosocaldus islandicus]|jgi:hypothetical protein|uniref:Uncharacterized protein n=2 Tax=Candidatus Nitrosocaldus cavascurensis TaxID=2058097 RepID=A0A2K5APR6_9ARCH|nr:hypothetical protein [Candidatus Nitrosocaldus islandicus]SPC33625.1 conserved protein of unknown function [Candidatus Nitrosocaldus cavascurensis]